MSAVRRFLAVANQSNVFRFTIDTRLVKAGATDGSELNNRFVLPISNESPASVIIKVSDGREDIAINNQSEVIVKRTIFFANPGIYDITFIGYCMLRFYTVSPDILKITNVYECGLLYLFNYRAFYNCSNLIWDAPMMRTNTLELFFTGIKGFGPNAALNTYLVDKVVNANNVMSGIIQSPNVVFSGFFESLVNAASMYQNVNLSAIADIQLIAPNLTNCQGMLWLSKFTGRLVIKSNVLTNISQLLRDVVNPPSLGEVDIRNVTSSGTDRVITHGMSTTNVNSTLLGWKNNFDWSAIPSVTNKFTFDFYNSKYSNTTAVLEAKAFLESKGIVFTRLTMA